MKKVLVTGAGGVLGQALIGKLYHCMPGTAEQYDIKTLARTIAEIVENKTGKKVEIDVESSDIKARFNIWN